MPFTRAAVARRRSTRMPYVPSAKSPTARRPQAPHMPCTEIAPHGSSTFAFLSKNSTLQQTSAPAMIPITTTPTVRRTRTGAVMATSPASMPLHVIEMSGFPHFQLVQAIAMIAPADAASSVLTATIADAQVGRAERRAGVEAHPAEREHQRADHDVAEVVPGERPDACRPFGTCRCAARAASPARARPSRRSRAPRRTRRSRPRRGRGPATVPSCDEPAAAPHPVAVDRVDDRAHRDLGEDEAGEADALGDRADDDVAGGLHEHDLEQEEREHADVVAVPGLQEEAVQADHAGVAVAEDAKSAATCRRGSRRSGAMPPNWNAKPTA